MTSSIRLHVVAALAEGAAVTATATQMHYLRAVMRRTAGDKVLLFNGRDGEWSARIATIGRDGASLVAEQRTRVQAPEPDIWLLFAPLKRDATDLVARQATELGVAALHPVLTARTNAERVNTTRLSAIAAEAAEQCERLTVPAVASPMRLMSTLTQWDPARTLFVALERHVPSQGAATLPMDGARMDGARDARGATVNAASASLSPGAAALLVGPEGGFDADERALLLRHRAVRALPLGPRVLRAETAVVAGLALLLIPRSVPRSTDGDAASAPPDASGWS